jgi:hypothetical protein
MKYRPILEYPCETQGHWIDKGSGRNSRMERHGHALILFVPETSYSVRTMVKECT